MKDGIGEGYTRADHADVSNQLFASYAKVNDARDLASVIGEEELGETDKLYLDFGAHFEKEFWARAPMRTAPSTRAWTLAGACSPSCPARSWTVWTKPCWNSITASIEPAAMPGRTDSLKWR